jgi:hypothetical protein
MDPEERREESLPVIYFSLPFLHHIYIIFTLFLHRFSPFPDRFLTTILPGGRLAYFFYLVVFNGVIDFGLK